MVTKHKHVLVHVFACPYPLPVLEAGTGYYRSFDAHITTPTSCIYVVCHIIYLFIFAFMFEIRAIKLKCFYRVNTSLIVYYINRIIRYSNIMSLVTIPYLTDKFFNDVKNCTRIRDNNLDLGAVYRIQIRYKTSIFTLIKQVNIYFYPYRIHRNGQLVDLKLLNIAYDFLVLIDVA